MEKALDVFAETIDELTRRRVRHKALVIGEGPARPWMEERLPGAIYVGQQVGPDLARALASCDVLLNPSITEAFGNVTLEAMACALPVVAAEATGATNLVCDGTTGTLVEPGDVDAFADSIAAYAADPVLSAAHGQGGLAYARTQDWDHINGCVVDTYRRAIARRARLARMKG
jgi:glycosyltransferase involved in cell wall biosynthesis